MVHTYPGTWVTFPNPTSEKICHLAFGITVARGTTSISTQQIKDGARAPEIRLPTVSGGQVKLSELRGHPVFFSYWATFARSAGTRSSNWCALRTEFWASLPPCLLIPEVLCDTFTDGTIARDEMDKGIATVLSAH